MAQEKAVKLKSWGGSSGSVWDVNIDIASFVMTKIAIRGGDVVDRFEFCYDVHGKEKWFGMNGGNGGHPEMIELGAGNYLTSIEGWYGDYYGHFVINWLKFTDNHGKTYGPYGEKQSGTHFSVSIEDGKIVGFHGRGGSYLDAIGVYLAS